MIEEGGKIVLHYPEKTAITDPKTGEMREGEQLVIVLKAMGDEKEYTHQIPLDEDSMKRLPSTQQLDEWRDKGQLVIISASAVRSTPFEHKAKDDEGKPMKYPQPGKVFQVGNKNIEIGTVLSFSSYAIRAASEEDRQRAEEANGMYNHRRQQARQQSIVKRQEKAEKRAQQRIAESQTKKK